ncbi:MAG: fumarylacetoacetate hydrolase family protein [Thermomicrobiales bacterium]|nr:fumarylacetoacetate hydrolase family protein [Thermomicrobiales bacterium]
MPLCRFRAVEGDEARLGLIRGDQVYDLATAGGPASLGEALSMPIEELRAALDAIDAPGAPVADVILLAPIDEQEVWAAGVTYLRSRDARMEESQEKTVYDRVYDAARPEIFFKAMASRVSHPGEAVAVRSDSTWDVPEPELALVLTNTGEIAGYTIGNDVSSRSIEGENPLYLPQAKVYNRCAALGPVIALAWEHDHPRDATVRLVIERDGAVAFDGSTSTNQLHRTFSDLIGHLFQDNDFPRGAILMTGTGIVPPNEFTLEGGDTVSITIEDIGTLTNPVVRL